MQITKLNCSACGAPISVPDDVDAINCTSCGSFLGVQRGEGYVALKIIKEVASAIQESGKETQSAIRDGAYATKTELQKIQLSQENSMVEMQLNSLQGEIRELERSLSGGSTNPRALHQLRELRFREYTALERIRSNHTALAKVNSVETDRDLPFLERQLSLAQSAQWSLSKADQSHPQVRSALSSQSSVIGELQNKILQSKVSNLRRSLPSLQLSLEAVTDLEAAESGLTQINADLKRLDVMPKTPEVNAVLPVLRDRREKWAPVTQQYRTNHLRESLPSVAFTIATLADYSSATSAWDQINADIRRLDGMPRTPEVQATLKDLRAKREQWKPKTQQLITANLRESMLSATISPESLTDLNAAAKAYQQAEADIARLQQMPNSPEKSSLLTELRPKREKFQQQWRHFEIEHAQNAAKSLMLPDPAGLDTSLLQTNLTAIQNEMVTMSEWAQNDITRDFLQKLRKKATAYQKALQKLQAHVQTHPADALANSPAGGTSMISWWGGARFSAGFGLGFVIWIGVAIVGMIIAAFLNADARVSSSITLTVFGSSIFFGFIIGALVFSLFTWNLLMHPALRALMTSVIATIGTGLLFFAIMFLPNESSIGAGIMGAGICIVPIVAVGSFVLGWILFHYLKKNKGFG